VQNVTLNLSEVMKPSEALVTDKRMEDAILMRLHEYIHDKGSTLKQVFMEFDRDGSGQIDHQELYYALRHLGFVLDFGECRTIIHAIETRAAKLEKQADTQFAAYRKSHMRNEELDVAGGYSKHVDGKIDYKEILGVLNDMARVKGLSTNKSRFTSKGQLKKRQPGSSILKSAASASKIKGVRGIQGLNSLYRTHARITGRATDMELVHVENLDIIGPILPVDSLEPDQFGLLSADALLYPVRAETAQESPGLCSSENRCVEIDAVGSPNVQAIAELLEGLHMDHSQLHKNTLRKLGGDCFTLLEAACELQNLRLFILAVEQVLEGGGKSELAVVQEVIAEAFVQRLPAEEWHKMEYSLSGISAAMDVFWFTRCQAENQEVEDEYDGCQGMWKQMYCELRFQKHLRAGVNNLGDEELHLWDTFIGGMVENLDLSETAANDNTVAVCVAYCSNIKSLDVHDSKITDAAVDELAEHLKSLTWINIEDTAITGEGVEKLVQAFPNVELVG
jgi:Ca2+-binding EF-hand superfamily protein